MIKYNEIEEIIECIPSNDPEKWDITIKYKSGEIYKYMGATLTKKSSNIFIPNKNNTSVKVTNIPICMDRYKDDVNFNNYIKHLNEED